MSTIFTTLKEIFMYFKDLSKYDDSKANVYNIGWLDSNSIFDTGDFAKSTLQKLISLEEKFRTNQTRGTHECNFCDDFSEGDYIISGEKMFLGSAELWIPNKGKTKIYAAPDLILHYIYTHSYLPPIEFIEAVNDFDPLSDWNSKSVSFFRSIDY
jgi:hypothetical protein